jgi:hypothetical protein
MGTSATETRAKDGTLVLLNIHNQSEQESLTPLTPTVDLPSKPSLALITIAPLSLTSRLLPAPQYLSLTSSQAYLLRQCCLMITSAVNHSLHRQTPPCPTIIISIPILRRHIRQAAVALNRANLTTTELSHSGLLQRHLPFPNSARAAPTLQWFTLSSR